MQARPSAVLFTALAIALAPFSSAADTSAAAAASSSANGKVESSETIGVTTAEKRIVGTLRDTSPSGPSASDQALLNRVVAALVRDASMKGVNIEVDVQSGIVTLNGNVRDERQASRAIAIASGVAGGDRVTSQLAVKG